MTEGRDKLGVAVERIAQGDVTLWTAPELRAAAAAAGLLAPRDLAALGGRPLAVEGGRGATLRFELDGVTVVAKQLRRGGLLRRLLDDRFASTARLDALREVQLELERRGVALAPFAFARARRAGAGFELEFATRELAGARDAASLLAQLAAPGGRRERRELIAAAARAIRALHAAGCLHADLNARNVLLARDPPRAWLIDFDKSRLEAAPRGLAPVAANLARLLRSAEKERLLGVRGLEAGDLAAFVRAYVLAASAESPPAGLRRAALWRAVASRYRATIRWHRLGWRLFGRGRAGRPR